MSGAQTATINANDHVLEYNKKLADLLVENFTDYQLDHYFSKNTPSLVMKTSAVENHPSALWVAQKINKSKQQETHLNTLKLPSVSLWGIPGPGSGLGGIMFRIIRLFTILPEGVGVDRMNYIVGSTSAGTLLIFTEPALR
ncbi:hypothetical protein EJ377_14300 [Chryseobacterium arthrosphaerae]|uniref:Uncharacterized protein n=1 Tax=Chryseobacterium arthrosphaerae TaxID=651561 RepID=A0A3S0PNA9_9FLAO|nr:hypothetical protein EJ377_14300 [Chryseobacterium arthrosphaerae]